MAKTLQLNKKETLSVHEKNTLKKKKIEEYETYGLSAWGAQCALLAEDEVKKLIIKAYNILGKDSSPWDIKDFLEKCISVNCLTNSAIEKYYRRKDEI
jgi:hypothetical protein